MRVITRAAQCCTLCSRCIELLGRLQRSELHGIPGECSAIAAKAAGKMDEMYTTGSDVDGVGTQST